MEDTNEPQTISREIAPGVILHKDFTKNAFHSDAIGMFIWQVEITTMSVVDFQVFLDESENIELDNVEGSLQTSVKILPFEKKQIAKIYIYNNSKLKSRFKLSWTVPDKSIQSKYIQNDVIKNKELMLESQKALQYLPLEYLSQRDLNKVLLEKGISKFTDFDFPPNDESILCSQYDANMNVFEYVIHWRRPESFVFWEDLNSENISGTNEVKLFHGNEPEPNDICHGLLPDQHWVSAISGIAEKYNLVKRLFKTEEVSKYGIYQIQLYWNGAVTTVIVDDLFPCIPMGNPIFARSPSNELWVLWIEKALAKAFTCYYILVSMNITDFLLILTGCPTFYFLIDELTKGEDKTGLVNKLMEYVSVKKYLVVAISKTVENEQDESTDNSSLTVGNGGYTLWEVKQKRKEYFIYLRKIWFDPKKDENVSIYENKFAETYPDIKNDISEGKLILTLDDFLKEFSSLAVCYTHSWDEIRLKGKFIIGMEHDSSQYEQCLSKWYYILTATTQINTIISLFQDEDKYRDNESRKQLMDISWSVFKFDPSTNEISHVQTWDFAHSPSLQMELSLASGQYIIIPRSSGCFLGKIADLKANCESNEEPWYDKTNRKYKAVFTNTIKDIFNKYDLQQLNKLRYQEFKWLYETMTKASISQNEFNSSILQVYNHYEDGWTERGLIQYFEKCYQEKGESEIRKWLRNLEYDDEWYCNKSRCFMWNIHSEKEVSVEMKETINSSVNENVNKILLKNWGEIKENNGNKDVCPVILVSKLNNTVTFGVKNKTIKRLRVKVNLKDIGDIIYNMSSEIEKIIEGNDIEYFGQFYSFNPDKLNSVQLNIESSNT